MSMIVLIILSLDCIVTQEHLDCIFIQEHLDYIVT